MDNIKIRATFSKTGRAKYISHLDLNKTMQRAIKRSKIPLWYTEGFHTHMYIMFPLALSLGVDSKCELMDFVLIEDIEPEEIRSRLNAVLPEGLQVSKVASQEKKHTEIAFSEYKLCITSDISFENTNEKFDGFLNFEKIEIEKRTKKKGINFVDIKPFINVISKTVTQKGLELVVRLPAGVLTNINPSLVIEAFQTMCDINIEVVSIERTKILCENCDIFA